MAVFVTVFSCRWVCLTTQSLN